MLTAVQPDPALVTPWVTPSRVWGTLTAVSSRNRNGRCVNVPPLVRLAASRGNTQPSRSSEPVRLETGTLQGRFPSPTPRYFSSAARPVFCASWWTFGKGRFWLATCAHVATPPVMKRRAAAATDRDDAQRRDRGFMV
jgi:hypothetical protein